MLYGDKSPCQLKQIILNVSTCKQLQVICQRFLSAGISAAFIIIISSSSLMFEGQTPEELVDFKHTGLRR